MIVNILLILFNLVAYSSGQFLDPVLVLSAVISRYPGYQGPLSPAGQLYLTYAFPGIHIVYKFTNLEANATGGFHIHTGTSCSSHLKVGGHYWNFNGSDPWIPVKYTSDTHGISKGSDSLLQFTSSEVLGRAVVVHNQAGDRVGCGLLTFLPILSLELSGYPGYNGMVNVGGNVQISTSQTGITLTYAFIGLEPNATGGWHVHSGLGCSSQATVGGHYFNDSNMYLYPLNRPDPWIPVKYTSDTYGNAQGQINMVGFTVADVSGRAVVVHDAGGARVGCAARSRAELPLSASIGKYPGYNVVGSDPVGQVRISEITGGISLTYGFIGLEPNVTAGWHVHVGTSCNDANNVGGHFYPGMSPDPWTSVKYSSDGYGTSTGKIIMTGFTVAMVSNRTIVIHSSSNTRVACGHINPQPASSPTTSSWTGQPSSQLSPVSESKIIALSSSVVTSNAERVSYSFLLFTFLIGSFLNL